MKNKLGANEHWGYMCLNRFHSMQKQSQAASGPRRIEVTHKRFLKHPVYLENIIISLFPTRKTASPNPVPSWQVCLSTILHPQVLFNYYVSNLTYRGLRGYRSHHRKLHLRGKSVFLSIISEFREPVWGLVFPSVRSSMAKLYKGLASQCANAGQDASPAAGPEAVRDSGIHSEEMLQPYPSAPTSAPAVT